MIHEVIVECENELSVDHPTIKLKVKCKYNPPQTQGEWWWLDPSGLAPTIDIVSITTDDDVSDLLSDDMFEECYTKALDKVEDLGYGIQEGKFINIEAEE